MSDDDHLLAQGTVDARTEECLHRLDYEDDYHVDDYYDDDEDEWDCTHCGGKGTCDDNADPLWDCDDSAHPCHACGGSGRRSDQRIF